METTTNQQEVKHKKFKEILALAIARTSEENPYPLDIFIGETKEGKIGKHCHDVWNNCLNKLYDNINELLEENAPNQSQETKDVLLFDNNTSKSPDNIHTENKKEIVKDYEN